jgi:hypothetical protein
VIFGAAAYGSVEYGGLLEYVVIPVVPPSRLRIIKVAWEYREFSVPREARAFQVAASERELTVARENRVIKVGPEIREFPQ